MDLSLRMQREIAESKRRKTCNLFQTVGVVGFVIVIATWTISLAIIFRNKTGDAGKTLDDQDDDLKPQFPQRGLDDAQRLAEAAVDWIHLDDSGNLKPPSVEGAELAQQFNGLLNVTDRRNGDAGVLGAHGMLRPHQILANGNGIPTPILEDYEVQREFLNRMIPDFRSPECKTKSYPTNVNPQDLKITVIVIFSDEPKGNLLRTMHSVLNRTPARYLEELLLVDDGSKGKWHSEKTAGSLEAYVNDLPKTRLVRNAERTGIVGARLLGIREAKSGTFAMLDSHVEVAHGWADPLVFRIAEDRKRIVMPVIDGIDGQSKEVTRGGIGCVLGILWRMVEHSFPPGMNNPDRADVPPQDYITSPTMAGGIFAADRDTFLQMGGYDPGITFWGVENVELSFRWWQCGGTIECTQCSRVAHIFGGYRGYSAMKGASVLRNKLRTAAVWMDEFADLAWKMTGRVPMDLGDISERVALREQLGCKDFKWFMDNVWPESDILRVPDDIPYFGRLSHPATGLCVTPASRGPLAVRECKSHPSRNDELIYFRRPGRITPATDEEVCASNSAQNLRTSESSLTVVRCTEERPAPQHFYVTGNGELAEMVRISTEPEGTGLCWEVLTGKSEVNLKACDGGAGQEFAWQKYEFEELPWSTKK